MVLDPPASQDETKIGVDLVEILDSIDKLKQAIDDSAKATISTQLIRIHRDLFHKPECFGLLSESEISTIIKGIQLHTSHEILVGKERPRAKKSFSNDDLDLDL